MPKPYQPPPIDWHQQPSIRTITASKLLDLHPVTIRRMIHDGRLQAYCVNRKGKDKYRISTASLLTFITNYVKPA